MIGNRKLFLLSVVLLPMTDGIENAYVLQKKDIINENKRNDINRQTKRTGDNQLHIIKSQLRVKQTDSHEQSKISRDLRYQSPHATSRELKGDRHDNVFNHFGENELSSKNSKKDVKDNTESQYMTMAIDTSSALTDIDVPTPYSKHTKMPIERNVPTDTPVTTPTPTPTQIPIPIPTQAPTLPNFLGNRKDFYTRIGDMQTSNKDDRDGESENPSPSNPTILSTNPPSVAPIRLPTRTRNYIRPPTRSGLSRKYDGDIDLITNSTKNEDLCGGNNGDRINDDRNKTGNEYNIPANSENEDNDDEESVPIVSDEEENEEVVDRVPIVSDGEDNNKVDVSAPIVSDEEEKEEEVDRVPVISDGEDEEVIDSVPIISDGEGSDGFVDQETDGGGNEDDTNQGALENVETIGDPVPSNYTEGNGLNSPDVKEENSKEKLKNVLIGVIPSCLVLIAIATFLLYRLPKSSRKYSTTDGKGPAINLDKIDDTIPLDQTGRYSKYSRMDSHRSFGDLEDIFPEPSIDYNFSSSNHTPLESSGVHDGTLSRFDSSSDQSFGSKSLYESEGDGQLENVEDYSTDEDDEESSDDDDDDGIYKYDYDIEMDDFDNEEIDEEVEDTSESFDEEEFLSTIEEEDNYSAEW